MGIYINPKDCTKEEWLEKNGTRYLHFAPFFLEDGKELPVCLVDNGPFTAAAICYSRHELEAFNRFDDTRPKKWYSVSKEKLLEVSPELKNVR